MGTKKTKPEQINMATLADLKVKAESFTFGDAWSIDTVKGAIMTQRQEEALTARLAHLPRLPDMVFADNALVLRHTTSGLGVTFAAADALARVGATADLQVAAADEWKEARKDTPHVNRVVKPFDWTFTPAGYAGRIEGAKAVEPSQDRKIDYEALKVRENILFYDDIVLYEDELDDHGRSALTVKVRVMASGFFVLARFYLRVDATLVRIVDTRLRLQAESGILLRETSLREATASELEEQGVSVQDWMDSNLISDKLKLKEEVTEEIKY